MTRPRTLAAALAAALLAALPLVPRTAPAQPLPIFDAHVHYGQNDWAAHPPADVLRAFAAAGVARALVSSTPDDGTLRLRAAAPERVAPFLRPYRGAVNSGNWMRDDTLLDYLKGRLERGGYLGIGEFHLPGDEDARTSQVRAVAALAVERGLFVQVHSGAGPVRALFALQPGLKVLWAHAGMSEPPEEVGKLLDAHGQLWTEVSFRAGEIASGDGVAPAWRALFQRHPDRFLVGTDTYVTSRWDGYGGLIAEHRHWLDQLPRDLAERIAWRNAVRLFGSGGVKELEP
jgi:predicted TIM-barrel fold metal-dependent hydrolase